MVAAGVGYFMMQGGNKVAPAPASTTAPATATSTAPAPAPAAANPGRKEVLNQLIAASRENRWAEVKPTLTAIKALAQPAAGDKAAASKLQEQGNQALKASKFEEALAAFEKAGVADPSSMEARLGQATAQVRSGKFDAASATLVEALLVGPENGAAWLLASETFAELDKNEAALACLKLAVHLAKDREKAVGYLQGAESNIKSAKFKAVVLGALPQLKGVPAR